MIQTNHKTAYFKGLDDAEKGIPYRLEICDDPQEHDFYLKGRQAAKSIAIPDSRKTPVQIQEEVEPLPLEL